MGLRVNIKRYFFVLKKYGLGFRLHGIMFKGYSVQFITFD
jgi:hypothetical protein